MLTAFNSLHPVYQFPLQNHRRPLPWTNHYLLLPLPAPSRNPPLPLQRPPSSSTESYLLFPKQIYSRYSLELRSSLQDQKGTIPGHPTPQ